MADGTINVKAGALSGTSMRYHELALLRWLNRLFVVREGYPCPVVFATPMDAFSQFTKLWSAASNPFQYLLNAVTDDGTPLYEPYPAPVRYPLISVYRKGFKYRQYQNFSTHNYRHINWPTVSDDVGKCGLGNVTTSRMPMAWDYRFQIDHFSLRPDTQAFFIEKLMWEMYKSGGAPQTWIEVNYPVWGRQLVRVYIDGDIENSTPEEPEADKNVEFRTTVNIVVEGFSVDLNFQVLPALWELLIGTSSVDPVTLENGFNPVADVDLRFQDANPTLDDRRNVPSDVHCQQSLNTSGSLYTKYAYFEGIGSSAAFGTMVITQGTVPVVPTVDVYGTESSSQTSAFQVGSLILAPYNDVTVQLVTLNSGTLFNAVVHAGTFTEAGAVSAQFQIGTLSPITVEVNAGTESSSTFVGFLNGSADLVAVSAGSLYDYGTQASQFYAGTNLLVSISTGTSTEQTRIVSTLQGGSLDAS